eukprot:COSAG01_NODE_5815_length_4017_cov_3.964267_4_plen_73_part_00
MLGDAAAAFHQAMMPDFMAERAYGAAAVQRVYDAMAAGHADARVTYVCSMWSELEHEPIPQATPPLSSVARL